MPIQQHTTQITCVTTHGKLEKTAHTIHRAGNLLAVCWDTDDGGLTWTVTHWPSGLAVIDKCHTLDAASRAARAFWLALSAADRKRMRMPMPPTGDMESAGDALYRGRQARDKANRHRDKKPPAADSADSAVPVLVTNRLTLERRRIVLTAADAIDGGICTGPCECTIEPDTYCAEGWPARQQAIIQCCA